MPTGGLGFCHICSASGPEARLGVFNPQTQFQVGGRTRQPHQGSQCSLAQGNSAQCQPVPGREASDHPQAPGPSLTWLCSVPLKSQLAHTLSQWLFKILPA